MNQLNHQNCHISFWGNILTPIMALLLSMPVLALDWPQEITADEGTIVVYQPQPETLNGNVLSGRAAMSLELKNQKEPIFGAFWFDAKIDSDTDSGVVTIRDVKVSRVRWPDSTESAEKRFTTIVGKAAAESSFEISIEQLSASLDNAEVVKKSLADIKNDPPEIVFSEELAVLLLYDGEPHYSAIEKSNYERVLNTPFAVARNKKSRIHYLTSGNVWYQAKNALGPWSVDKTPPKDLVAMVPKPDTEQTNNDKREPKIIAAQKPTELIVTDGKPDWKSLAGGELLYVKNTETPWLRELSSNNMFLLLSGRWYKAKTQAGPWTFVRADQLPASFKNIPPASDIGGLRTSVAGTEEANDALLDAQIPQTAAIKKSEAKLTIEYDGEPTFEAIKGTEVSYAINTGAQVLKIKNRFYAVDNGVWFVADKAEGPWKVAETIPEDEIAKIPASSPVYNTTYVHIYDSTPEVVYVGYTPGYLWSFPYYGVPVYGTGWYYRPYWGGVYYPRPPTWGLHVGYNPWTGWNYGVSWSNGFFSIGMSWGGGWGATYRPGGCCGGWYGGGYRRPVVINTGNINIGNTVNIGNRTDISNRIGKSNNLNFSSNTNIYQRTENRQRNADKSSATRSFKKAKPSSTRENNIFADQNGNVARPANNGWETRENKHWTSEDISDRLQSTDIPRPERTRTTQDFTRPGNLDRQSLNNAFQSRQRGAQRQNMRSGGVRRRR